MKYIKLFGSALGITIFLYSILKVGQLLIEKGLVFLKLPFFSMVTNEISKGLLFSKEFMFIFFIVYFLLFIYTYKVSLNIKKQ